MIHIHLCIEYTTKTRYLMFKLINFIVCVQIFTYFEFDFCNTFQNSWDVALCYFTVPFTVWELRTLIVEVS